MGEFGIGQPVPREEDPYLVRGAGRYVDDVHGRRAGTRLCAALAARPCPHRRRSPLTPRRRCPACCWCSPARTRRCAGSAPSARRRRASGVTAAPPSPRRSRSSPASGCAMSAIPSPSSSPRRWSRRRTRPKRSRSTTRCCPRSRPPRKRSRPAPSRCGRAAPTTRPSPMSPATGQRLRRRSPPRRTWSATAW